MNTKRLHKASKRRRQVELKRLFLAMFAAVIVAGCSLFVGAELVDAHDTTEEVMCKYYRSIEIIDGDTLWSIANKYNVSINSIRMINNLNSDILSIGQTLIIP